MHSCNQRYQQTVLILSTVTCIRDKCSLIGIAVSNALRPYLIEFLIETYKTLIKRFFQSIYMMNIAMINLFFICKSKFAREKTRLSHIFHIFFIFSDFFNVSNFFFKLL